MKISITPSGDADMRKWTFSCTFGRILKQHNMFGSQFRESFPKELDGTITLEIYAAEMCP